MPYFVINPCTFMAFLGSLFYTLFISYFVIDLFCFYCGMVHYSIIHFLSLKTNVV